VIIPTRPGEEHGSNERPAFCDAGLRAADSGANVRELYVHSVDGRARDRLTSEL